MSESLPFSSSVYVLTLDDYSLFRINVPDSSAGDKIYIRPKDISIKTYPSTNSPRYGKAVFLYRNKDGETRTLSFKNKNGENESEFRFKLSADATTIHGIFRELINELAKFIATGIKCVESPFLRKSLLIEYSKRVNDNLKPLAIKEEWEVLGVQTVKTSGFDNELVSVSNYVSFKNASGEFMVKVPYEQYFWKQKACSVFCKQFRGGIFKSLSPAKINRSRDA